MSTILFVESDPLEAHLMLPLLRQKFGEVRRATDAAEALGAIEHPDFAGKLNLVISGRQTQGIDGPTFVAEFHDRMPAVPVLVLGTRSESANDYASEYVAFLPWPLVPGQVLALASKMLAGERRDKVA